MRAILGVFAVGSLAAVSGAACGDSEGNVSGKTDTGGRASSSSTGGAEPDTGGTAQTGGAATGGKATATFGGFESTGGRSESGGSTPAASGGSPQATTGGAASDVCQPLPTPEAPVYDGDFTIASAADAEEARKYREFTGALSIGVAEIELPMLTRIGGDLASQGTTAVRLPALTEVEGSIYYYLDYDIEVLDLRNLLSVGDRFYLHRNLSLRELQIDALVDVGGQFDISANLKLPDCFLDVIDTRYPVLHTVAPAGCTCTRSCGVVTVACE